MPSWFNQVLTFILQVLATPANLTFFVGLVLGILLGGAGAFIYYHVTKQVKD